MSIKGTFSRCSQCGAPSEVIDSREQKTHIRRRRKCLNTHCQYRWTTHELSMESHAEKSDKMDMLILEAMEKLKEARRI